MRMVSRERIGSAGARLMFLGSPSIPFAASSKLFSTPYIDDGAGSKRGKGEGS